MAILQREHYLESAHHTRKTAADRQDAHLLWQNLSKDCASCARVGITNQTGSNVPLLSTKRNPQYVKVWSNDLHAQEITTNLVNYKSEHVGRYSLTDVGRADAPKTRKKLYFWAARTAQIHRKERVHCATTLVLSTSCSRPPSPLVSSHIVLALGRASIAPVSIESGCLRFCWYLPC